MEKPIVCENITVYDYRAHCRFNELMVGRSQWLMYAIATLLGALLIVAYCFMKAAVVLIFAIVILAVMLYMLFIRKYKESTTLTEKLRTQRS